MSAGKITSKTREAYKFIDAHRDEFSIQMMCRLLGVARADYYDSVNIRFPIEREKMRGCFA